MFEVDSLFVVATSRGPHIAHDMIKSILWSCQQSCYVVIVDRKGDIERIPGLSDGYTVLTTDATVGGDAWIAGLGLRWAVDQGIQAKQFVILDDRCLIINRGIDTWSLKHIQREGIGLIGVRDRLNYEDAYKKCTPWFDMWDMPHTTYEPNGDTLHESALWLSSELVSHMHSRSWLPPDGFDQWPMPYGPFVSWASQMLGYHQVGWGTMDKRLPPLFINFTGRSSHMPEPHVLSPKFSLYFSAKHCQGYSEDELREAYKTVRGEPARVINPFGPEVLPQRTEPTEAG